MDAETTFPDARVVVFSRDAHLAGRAGAALDDGPDRCFRAATAYEAAAEALAGGAALLVVDSASLAPRHAGLLHTARRCGLAILAVGAPPAGLAADDWEAVRVVAPEELAAAVAHMLAAGPPASSAAPDSAAAASDHPPTTAPHSLISPEELAALLEKEG